MAGIPTFEQLGTVAPQADTSVSSVRPSPVGDANAGLGDTIAQSGAAIQDSNDQYALASAKANFLKAQIQTEDSLKHDQDYATHADRYSSVMDQTQQNLAQTIPNPKARAMFQADTSLDAQRGLSSVKDNAFALGANYRKADTDTQIQTTMQAAAAKRDPVVLASAISAVNGMVQANVQAGITTPEEAQQQVSKIKSDYAGQAVKDLPFDQQVKLLAPHVVTPGSQPNSAAMPANLTGAPTASQLATLTDIVKQHESGGKDYNADGSVVTSPVGAKGAMQVMDASATDPGYGVRPAQNDSLAERDRVGTDYLTALVDKYGIAKGVAAYNAGPGKLDKAVSKADAAGTPGAWLQNLPTATQKYVAGISSDFQQANGTPTPAAGPATDATGPTTVSGTQPSGTTAATPGTSASPAGAVGANPNDPTNALLGFLTPEAKQAQYTQAAENSIYGKMETDPQAAIQLTMQPEYQGLGAEKLSAMRVAARDQFEKLRGISQQNNIMAQAQNNQSLWNDFQTGKLNLSNFAVAQQAAQDSGHPIDPQLSNYMIKAMTATPPKQTEEAMASTYNDLADRSAALLKKNSSGRIVGVNDLQQYVDFQTDVAKGLANGLVTTTEADRFMKPIATVFNAQVQTPNDPNNPGFIGQHILQQPESPYAQGYDAINANVKASSTGNPVQDNMAKAEILRRFVAAQELNEQNGNKSDPGAVARSAIASYNKTKFPVLQLLDTMPNSILLGAGQKQNLTPQATAKPDVKVSAPPFDLMRDKNGSYAKVFKDGHVEELSPADAAKYSAQGQ